MGRRGEKTTRGVCFRSNGARAPPESKTALLRALGSAAGPFEAVRQAANGRRANVRQRASDHLIHINGPQFVKKDPAQEARGQVAELATC